MPVKEYVFSGKVKYVYADRLDKFGNYSVVFYPKDAQTRKAIKATGIKNNPREDQDGEWFFTFRSKEPIPVSGLPEGKYIGWGTEADLVISVEDFMSQKWGKVVRSGVIEIRVTKLIPYEVQPQDEVPA